jgi:hypothetical protein
MKRKARLLFITVNFITTTVATACLPSFPRLRCTCFGALSFHTAAAAPACFQVDIPVPHFDGAAGCAQLTPEPLHHGNRPVLAVLAPDEDARVRMSGSVTS